MGALYDLVGFTTTTTGTGTITVGTALSGHRTPAGASIPDGTVVSYGISSADGSLRETGTGTLGASAATMTRVFSASTTGALINLTGESQVFITALAADFVSGGGAYEVADFAALQALAGVPDGRVYTVLAPVCVGGRRGIQFVRDGSIWRPAGLQTVLYSTVDLDMAASAAEQIMGSAQFVAGVLPGAAFVKTRFRMFWPSAASGAFIAFGTRVGTAGTTSDAIIDTNAVQAGNNVRSFSSNLGLHIVNATTIRKTHSTPGNFEATLFRTDTIAQADATVPSMLTNSTFVSTTIILGGGSANLCQRRYFQVIIG